MPPKSQHPVPPVSPLNRDEDHNPKIIFRNPPFSFHRSLVRYCIPLSKFSKLPSNTGKRLVVGAAIVEPPPTHYASENVESPHPASSPVVDTEPTHLSHPDLGAVPGGVNGDRGVSGRRPRVLLVQRARDEEDLPGSWELPGGHAEFGLDQTILEAVVRETREETGLTVIGIKGGFPGFEYDTVKGRSKQYNFVVEVDWGRRQGRTDETCQSLDVGGDCRVRSKPEDRQDWRWIEREDVAGLEMSKEMRECVSNALIALENVVETTPVKLEDRGEGSRGNDRSRLRE